MPQPIDLPSALGTILCLRGRVRRTKLADVLVLDDGGEVHCDRVRFPDDQVGQLGAAEGRLGRRTLPRAQVDARGAWSQGVADDTEVWVLEGCRIV